MLNHIVLMGRLTRDPELRYTASNVPVASFTVAVDRDYGRGENGEKQTDFINVSAWRQTGEFVSKYFTKGSMIAVSGRLQIREYTDRDGNRRTAAEVVADNVYFGDSKRRDDGEQPARSSYSPSGRSGSQDSFRRADPAPGAFEDLSDDDGELPF
jgi:single-strand DNA-binding protein